MKKDFIKIDDSQVFSSFSGTLVRFSITIDNFGFDLLRPAETSLMIWLYGNAFIKRAALFAWGGGHSNVT